MEEDKEKWSDKMKRVFKNGVAPFMDDGGHRIGGTMIKAGQEVIYSKIIRKVMKRDQKSWMHQPVNERLRRGPRGVVRGAQAVQGPEGNRRSEGVPPAPPQLRRD